MRQVHLLILAACCSTILISSASGQQKEAPTARPQVGVVGGLNLNMHRAGFTGLPGIPSCCNGFDNGRGTGFFIGPAMMLTLGEAWDLGIELVYSDISATLTKEQDIGPVTTPRGIEQARVEYRIASSTQLLDLRPTLRFRLFDNLPLSVFTGSSIGIFLANDFTQSETLLQPDDHVFSNGRRTRNTESGAVPDGAGIAVSFNAGMAYEVALSPSWSVMPLAGFQAGITSLSGGVSWLPGMLYLGAGVLYRLPTPAPPPPPPPPPPLPAIDASLKVRALAADNSPLPAPKILVENTIRRELFPMLPYVFFRQDDAQLAATSQRPISGNDTRSFNSAALPGNTLTYYGNLLNIVGERMRLDEAATITLTGCNNMQGTEKNNTALSRRRAEAVRDYLVDTWGIASRRITIRTRNLPKEAPDPTLLEGQEEARRVEISSDSPTLLAPILKQDGYQTVAYCSVDFIPQVVAESGLRAWSLEARQGERALFTRSGEGSLPGDLRWALDSLTAPQAGSDVVATLHITDKVGQMRSAQAGFRVERETRTMQEFERAGDRRIDRFNLILFEFNKSALGAENSRIIGLVKSAIEPGADITIRGYADRTGDPELNRRLARERCDAVQAALGTLPRDVTVHVEAIGSDHLLYDNDIPEGRNFCRTVVIIIER